MLSTKLWQPKQAQVEQTNMWTFMQWSQRRYATLLSDYTSLYQWSINEPEQFWAAVWEFCEVKASQPWDKVLSKTNNFPGYQWFSGSRLNFAKNLLRHCQPSIKDNDAIVFDNENGERRSLSYAELYANVARLSQSLQDMDVQAGDRVAGYLPNVPESIIAMLASTAIGAVWTSCSPDFGINGVMDRFGQVKPKVLFTADGYYYKGKSFQSLSIVKKLAAKLKCIEKIVIVPYVNIDSQPNISNAVMFDTFINQNEQSIINFAALPFHHPLYIMYSSGTTGAPKCIVHSAGGTLIQHLKELILHTDLSSKDKIFYFTTCGWMMWNWLASSLATGACVLLYDGTPTYPKADILFDFAQREKMTVFGTSAKYISAIEKAGIQPGKTHDLSCLRTMLSTGSPLAPESFDYVYKHIKKDIQLSSISGGTDIISCFALGNPILPVYRGELQCAGLGMNVKILNQSAEPVFEQKGELACIPPFPSMPITFWNDPDHRKYRNAYFEKYQGYWAQGDFAQLTSHGGIIIYGRSDAVLNPGGVRIGTAEIYRQVEKLPEIMESIAVGQNWHDDIRIILFVKLEPKLVLDEKLKKNIAKTIRKNTTPRHVPAKIIQVADIPRTISGKIVELAVQNVIHNRPVKNIDALANPEALDAFRDIPELKLE